MARLTSDLRTPDMNMSIAGYTSTAQSAVGWEVIRRVKNVGVFNNSPRKMSTQCFGNLHVGVWVKLFKTSVSGIPLHSAQAAAETFKL